MFAAVWSIDDWASYPCLARPAREAREKALSINSDDRGVVGRFSKGWLIGYSYRGRPEKDRESGLYPDSAIFPDRHVLSNMTHHDADEIVPPGQLQQRVKIGRVSQIHRPDRPAEEDDTFEIENAPFLITDVTERPVSAVGIGDARTEAARSMAEFRQRMTAIDPDFEWAEDSTLVRYQFRRKLPSDEE
jgi:hypothetical protein